MQGRIRQVRKMPGDSGACRTMPRQDNQKVREVLRAKHRTGPDVGSFAEGLVPSIEPNLLSAAGIRTAVALDASRTTEIRSIQGAVRVPEGFGRIRTIRFEDHGIVLVPEAGPPVSVPVRHDFLMERTPSR